MIMSSEESDNLQPDPVEEVPAALAVEDPILDALLGKIQPIASEKRPLKVLIYSEPGIGKTSILGQAPDNLIVDVERGLLSLQGRELANNVKVYPYNQFSGLDLLVNRLQQRVAPLDWIKILSVDSVSELHKKGLAEITEREAAKSPGRSEYLAETDNHAENNEKIRRLVSSFRDLDRGLLLTAHARTIEPKGEMPRTFPDFSEKLANTLSGIMDIVAYMSIKRIDGENKRVLRFHTNGQIMAKTRLPGFPEEMIDPTWDKIMEIYNNN